MFAYILFDLVFRVLNHEIGWEERLEMTYFVTGGT